MLRQAPRVTREIGASVAANAISVAKTASRLMPISSDAKTLDGLNVQVAVCDEIASHKTAEVYDALRTAMGKRRHPLLLSISTATGNTAGIGKQLWDYSVRVLEGAQEDDRRLEPGEAGLEVSRPEPRRQLERHKTDGARGGPDRPLESLDFLRGADRNQQPLGGRLLQPGRGKLL